METYSGKPIGKLILIIVFMTFLYSCIGPAGPPGEDGIDGADGANGVMGPSGADGTNGTDGTDANATCIYCHNDNSDILAKQLQAGNSGHMTKGNFERSDAGCAGCHTHEGFMDRMARNDNNPTDDIDNPTPPNCRTCHNIHISYDSTDWELTYAVPVTLWIDSVVVDLGKGNLCANCHQPRIPNPMFGTGSDVEILSSRWGPHHGAQSPMIWGTSAFEVAGSETYPSPGSHSHVSAQCILCHMSAVFGSQAGGHTLNMTIDNNGVIEDYLAGCNDCHSGLDDFDYNGAQTEVEGLFEDLFDELLGLGMIDSFNNVVKQIVSSDMAGYIYNYKFVLEDGSMGIHNPSYAYAILTNTIEAIQAGK
ncbi:collagen-like protein [Bacteroidota bacterium]